MNWKNIFGKKAIVTATDRAELEGLEKKCAGFETAFKTIESRFPTNIYKRGEDVGNAAVKYAEDPTEANFQKIILAGAFPSFPHTHENLEAALSGIKKRMNEILLPTHAIVKRCLRRALEAALDELRTNTAKEEAAAAADGVEYIASGRILALQGKIRDLQNEIGTPTPDENEEAREPLNWRQRLADYL